MFLKHVSHVYINAWWAFFCLFIKSGADQWPQTLIQVVRKTIICTQQLLFLFTLTSTCLEEKTNKIRFWLCNVLGECQRNTPSPHRWPPPALILRLASSVGHAYENTWVYLGQRLSEPGHLCAVAFVVILLWNHLLQLFLLYSYAVKRRLQKRMHWGEREERDKHSP